MGLRVHNCPPAANRTAPFSAASWGRAASAGTLPERNTGSIASRAFGDGGAAGLSLDAMVLLALLGDSTAPEETLAAEDADAADAGDDAAEADTGVVLPLLSAGGEEEADFAYEQPAAGAAAGGVAPASPFAVRDSESAAALRRLQFESASRQARQYEFALELQAIAARHNMSAAAVDEVMQLMQRVGGVHLAAFVAAGAPSSRRVMRIVDNLANQVPGSTRFTRCEVAVPAHGNLLQRSVPVWRADLRAILAAALRDASMCTTLNFMTDPECHTAGFLAARELDPEVVVGEAWDSQRLRALSQKVVELTQQQPYFPSLQAAAVAAGCQLVVLPVPLCVFGDEACVGARAQHTTDPWYVRLENITGPVSRTPGALFVLAYASRPDVSVTGSITESTSVVTQEVRQRVLECILAEPLVAYSENPDGPLLLEGLPGAPDVPGQARRRWLIAPFLATLPGDAPALCELTNTMTNFSHRCVASAGELAEVDTRRPVRSTKDVLGTYKQLTNLLSGVPK